MKAPTASRAVERARRVNDPPRPSGTQRITSRQLWGLALWRRRIRGRDERHGRSFQRRDHAQVQEVAEIASQAALAAERDGARRKRLTAFGQDRRFTRLVRDRLRRVRMMIATGSDFMVAIGRRARCRAMVETRRIRPSRAQVEQRGRKNQRDESTRGHGYL